MRLEIELENPHGIYVWVWTIWARVALPDGASIEVPFKSGKLRRLEGEDLEYVLLRISLDPSLLEKND